MWLDGVIENLKSPDHCDRAGSSPASGTIALKLFSNGTRPNGFARRCARSKPAGLFQHRASGARVRRLAAVRLEFPAYPASGTIALKLFSNGTRPNGFARRCARSKPAGLLQRALPT